MTAYVDPFQTLTFRAPMRIGDPVHVQVEGIGIIPERLRTRHAGTRHVDEEIVFDGEALVKVPSAASSLPDTRDEPQTVADSQVRNPSRPEGWSATLRADGTPDGCLENQQEGHKTCSCAASRRLKTTDNQVQLSDPSVVAEAHMISLEDLIGFCDLTPEEVQVVAEHEHVSQAAAAVLGNFLLQSQSGCEQIRDMVMDEIRAAVRQHDVPHARQLVSTLRHFLHEHPNAAFRDAA